MKKKSDLKHQNIPSKKAHHPNQVNYGKGDARTGEQNTKIRSNCLIN